MKIFTKLKKNLLYAGHALEPDAVNTKRIQLVNFIVIIGAPIFTFFMVVNYKLGFLSFAIANIFMLLLVLFGFFALRQSLENLKYAINAVFLSLLLSFGVTLFQGGILNSGFVWFFLFPMFAMLVKEKKDAIRWIWLQLGSILGFFIYAEVVKLSLPYDPVYLIFILAGLGIEVLILRVWQEIQSKYEEKLAEKSTMLEMLMVNLEQRVREEVQKSHEKDELLSHQSKLAAMGEMMNNIAHQWKQPLGTINVIVQNVQLARMLDQDDVDIDASLEEIINQTKLMNQAVYDFLNYSKPTMTDEAFDLNIAIQNSLELIRPRLRAEQITLHFNPADDGYEIFGKKNEFMHVLINILSNAREALAELPAQASWIEISTFRDQEQIVVQISDNAGGIPHEIINKIFDVYFSTKEDKGGTGLGLYMCKKIVEDGLQGTLTASNTNLGALFELRFDCLNCSKKSKYE